MSFDWNLSSDEEDGFDDWANVDLTASLTSEQAQKAVNSYDDEDDDDDDSIGTEEERNQISTVAFVSEETAKKGDGFGFDEDDDDENDDIDWEDAQDENDETREKNDTKLATDTPATMNLKPVTVDWSKDSITDQENTNKKSKRVRARKKYRFDHLPPDLKSFLSNLERVHLMCLTSHVQYISKFCSGEEFLNLSHSLLPLSWTINPEESRNSSSIDFTAPSERALNDFCSWFFDLVNLTEQRRRQTRQRNIAAGAPHRRKRKRNRKSMKSSKLKTEIDDGNIHFRPREYCSYLSRSNDDDPQLLDSTSTHFTWKEYEKVHLLIAMSRSLGWRARYVMALEPFQKDLDVNHPLFSTSSYMKDVFQMIVRDNRIGRNGENDDDDDRKMPAKKRPRNSKQKKHDKKTNGDDDFFTEENNFSSTSFARPRMVGWVEILCQCSQGKQKINKKIDQNKKVKGKEGTKFRWIHVDPDKGLIDQPHLVETILFAKREGMNNFQRTKKKLPIAYALAAEHIQMISDEKHGEDFNLNGHQKQQQYQNGIRGRLTDVTPRYASSFVESLKARSVLRGKQTKVKDEDRIDKWWSNTLKSLNSGGRSSNGRKNHLLVDKQRKNSMLSTNNGSTSKDAIVIDEESSVSSTNNNNGCKKEALNDNNNMDSAVTSSSAEAEAGTEGGKCVSSLQFNDDDDDNDDIDTHEKEELSSFVKNEPMPTSKTAFKSHPIYVIPSVLTTSEVLVPDAKKRICGVFKGELVYRRIDVKIALPEKKWYYKGRKVRLEELNKPIKKIKARKKPISKSFQVLNSYVGVEEEEEEEAKNEKNNNNTVVVDGIVMEKIYGPWQTDPWSPKPIGPNDPIPRNEYNNIELELLNPGLVHIDEHRIAMTAKQLGIPYVPCLLGFENNNGNGNGNNRIPTIRGIVIHQHNEELIREAHIEVASHYIEQEYKTHQQIVYKRWKKLLIGILTKDRLEKQYTNDE